MAEIAGTLNVNISQKELTLLEQRDLTGRDRLIRRIVVFFACSLCFDPYT